ncbi:capsid protein [Finch associated genomovirus 9]|nr:capsid protein [Finch associated genomovirus 9]
MPRYAKKRTTRRRRTYRKRRAPRRKVTRRTTAKRIKAIASNHKSDDLQGGQRSNADDGLSGHTLLHDDIPMDARITMTYFSPSAFAYRDTDEPRGRFKTKIYHTGYADKYLIHIGCDVPLLHRRIVYTNMYEDQRAWCGKIDSKNPANFDLYRNQTRLDLSALTEQLFAGTSGLDWQDHMRAPLNRNNQRIISDKLYTYSPKSVHGQEFVKNLYTPIKKTLRFNDTESGNDTLRTNKIFPALTSPKYFIVDLYRAATDTSDVDKFPLGTQYFSLGLAGKNYWRE